MANEMQSQQSNAEQVNTKSKKAKNLAKSIQGKFEPNKRFSHFGNMLMQIQARGFRCHEETIIDVRSPITAICGLNGTGKSTLLQLAAAAYENSDSSSRYYISSFINSNLIDTTPFANTARVIYRYWQSNQIESSKEIFRSGSRWERYDGRPGRRVLFIGVKDYLPTHERSDFMHRFPNQVIVSQQEEIKERIKTWTSYILGKGYEEINLNNLQYRKLQKEVISVKHQGVIYSEYHMGFGEARTQFFVRMIESLPNQSLILIEEPEISLHNSAQYKFAKYLMDACDEKGHQFILATHSDLILKALPSESIVHVAKDQGGIKVTPGVSDSIARSYMSEHEIKALTILVEDDCAEAILREIIRTINSDFLHSVQTFYRPGKGKDDLENALKVINCSSLPIVAVRDGDTSANPGENIFKLPGTQPPEKEIFGNEAVRNHIERKYSINMNDFMTELHNVNHHNWFERLSQKVSVSENSLMTQMAEVYVQNVPENDRFALVKQLMDATSGRKFKEEDPKKQGAATSESPNNSRQDKVSLTAS